MKLDKKNKHLDFRAIFSKRDEWFWQELDLIIKKHGISNANIIKHFMAFTRRRDITQFLAYYELFLIIKNKPGSIVEAGVFMGNGLFTWSKLMETFCPGDRGRKIYGFDNFNGYEKGKSKVDSKAIAYIKSLCGDFKVDKEFVERMVQLHNFDNMIPGVERVKLYAGELSKTIPTFLKQEEGVRLSLLLVDLNLYAPTKMVLNQLYDLIIPGGIVAFRGYGVRPWEGESKAVDEFLKNHCVKKVSKFPFSPYPAVFFIKR